jgi:PAS domain S-box-containing protein
VSGGKREREGGFDVLLVGDGIPWSCDAVGGADVDATGVESVAVARDQLEPGGVDCVVCGTGAGTDAVAALAGVDPGVPVVAVVESGADADRAVAAGADETCRVDDSATTLARRIDGVVVDARTALGTGEAVTGADPSREGFAAIAPDWTVREVSQGAAALLGEAVDSILGESLWEAFPGPAETVFRTQFERAKREGEPAVFTSYYEPLEAWFSVRAFPAADGLTVFFRDVSHHERLGEELVAARERTERMLERVEEAFLAVDEEWTLTYVNERAGEMAGRDPEELVGRTVWEVFPAAADLAFYEEAETAIENQETVNFQEYYPPLSVWMEVSVYPDSDGVSVFMRDVTERVKVERRGRRLIEATRDLMATDDVREVMTVASDAASDVLKFPGTAFRRYDPETESLESVALGSTVEDITDRPTYGVEDSPHGRAFRSGDTLVEDIGDDDEYDREPFSQTMYVPVGDYGVLSVGVTDGEFGESDRQLAELLAASTEAALDRASRHERLREHERTLDAVAGMVYALDDRGEFSLVSGALADRLGYDRETLLGEEVSTVVEDDENWTDLVEVPPGESVTHETEFVTTGGEVFPVEVDVATLADDTGAVRGSVGVVRDVSDLAAARERVERERSRFTYLFENLPDPAVEAELVDGEPVVRNVNDAFESVFGWSQAEMVDEQFNEYVLPDDRREEGRELDEQIQRGAVATQEVRRKTADGERYFLYRGVAYDDDGAGFGLYTDISERKRRQEYLRVINRVLRHNLRNDLSTIGGYAELVADSLGEEEVAEYARRIVETVEETADLTEDARELQSVVRHSTPAGGPVDAAAAIERAVAPFREGYPQLDLRVSAPESLAVRADEHLERAVEHLVENVVEHVEGNARVRVDLSREPDRARIRVSDDGPGIPEEERVVVDTDRETTQLQHGSGLGLWYVRFVAQASGGTVRITESAMGGAAVDFTVDLAEE